MRRFSRFHVFLIVSALLIGGVVVAAGLAVDALFERHVLDEEAAQTVEMVQNQAAQHLTAAAFTDAAELSAQFHNFFEGLPRIFRVKAFAPAARIVWSNEPRLIGQRFGDNRNLARALAGQTTTVVEPPRQSEHVFEQTRAHVAEAYVPIAFGAAGPVVGVVETYKDVSVVMVGVARVKRRIWIMAGSAGALQGAGQGHRPRARHRLRDRRAERRPHRRGQRARARDDLQDLPAGRRSTGRYRRRSTGREVAQRRRDRGPPRGRG